MSVLSMRDLSKSSNSNGMPLCQQLSRKKFLLFVKILFGLLEKSGDELLLEQAKLVVVQCRFSASSKNLEHIVEDELHGLVGGDVFTKAKQYLVYYLKKRDMDRTVRTMALTTVPKMESQTFLPRRPLMDTTPFNSMFQCSNLLAELEPSPFFHQV